MGCIFFCIYPKQRKVWFYNAKYIMACQSANNFAPSTKQGFAQRVLMVKICVFVA